MRLSFKVKLILLLAKPRVNCTLKAKSHFKYFLAGIGLVTAYGIYAFFALVSAFFVFWMVKETKGKELEEMTG